jgi:hypothetical protein
LIEIPTSMASFSVVDIFNMPLPVLHDNFQPFVIIDNNDADGDADDDTGPVMLQQCYCEEWLYSP